MSSGNLFTVFAPSGAGKTSLVRALVDTDSAIVLSVSHTTRSRRPHEVEGEDYFFVPEKEFLRKVEAGEFLEHAQVFGNYYGTSEQAVEQQLRRGFDVILEIDWQGVQQVARLRQDMQAIFILPPSRKTLEARLRARAQDSEEVIQRRMREARQEISHYIESNYLIINEDFDQALASLKSIIQGCRLKTEVQQQRHINLISELLS